MSTSTVMAGPAAGRGAWRPRTAFVLADGAAPGAMQAGMVHAPYERGIAPDLLVGTWAGALNAAFPASRPATAATADDLAALWRGLRRRDILPLRPATLLPGLAGRRDHLIPGRALRRLAARHPPFQRLEQAAIPLHLSDGLRAGTQVRLSGGPLAGAVPAAAAIPGVPPPVRWRGPPTIRATAACRARPARRWPPRCTRSPCSPTPACTATSPATPRPPS